MRNVVTVSCGIISSASRKSGIVVKVKSELGSIVAVGPPEVSHVVGGVPHESRTRRVQICAMERRHPSTCGCLQEISTGKARQIVGYGVERLQARAFDV